MDVLNIIVTGGSRGIGLGIVRALVRAGHRVAFCGRAEEKECAGVLADLKREFPSGFFRYYRCDVSDTDAHPEFLDRFESDFGGLDLLFNNAGVAPAVRTDLLKMTPESFDRVLGINLRGPFFLTQAAALRIAANPDGKFHAVINTSSVSADFASVERGEYCLSKAAVSMTTKLWAVRLAEYGIAVYEIRPGVVKSDMTGAVKDKYDRLIAGGLTLQKRWGTPDDVGRAAAALAAGDFAYSTGQVVCIDGGLSIPRF